MAKAFGIAVSRVGMLALAPLLIAAECNESVLTISQGSFNGRVGVQSVQTFRVVNTGGADAILGELSSSGLGLTGPFSYLEGTCTTGGVVPKSGGECWFRIAFLPTQAKTYTDTIELAYGWSRGSSTRLATRELSDDVPPPLIFQPPSTSSPMTPGAVTSVTYGIYNDSGYAMRLHEINGAALGMSPPFSHAGGTCTTGRSLAPSEGCTLLIDVAPEDFGTFTADLTLRYTWPLNGVQPFVQTERIYASADQPLVASISQPAHRATPVGTASTQTLTVTNTGPTPVTLQSLSAADPAFTITGGSCASGVVLAALGGSCSAELRFAATAPGTVVSDLLIDYRLAPLAGVQRLVYPVRASAYAPGSSNCFDVGCAAGQVCREITSDAAGLVGTCVTVPDPPPNCLAPCVWEARKKCLTVFGVCGSHVVPGDPNIGTISATQTTCDSKTGWALRELIINNAIPITREWRRDGVNCYSESFGVPHGEFFDVIHRDRTEPVGVSVVSSYDGRRRSVWCGPYTSTLGLDPAQAYVEDSAEPACAVWRNEYLSRVDCRSHDTYSCAGF